MQKGCVLNLNQIHYDISTNNKTEYITQIKLTLKLETRYIGYLSSYFLDSKKMTKQNVSTEEIFNNLPLDYQKILKVLLKNNEIRQPFFTLKNNSLFIDEIYIKNGYRNKGYGGGTIIFLKGLLKKTNYIFVKPVPFEFKANNEKFFYQEKNFIKIRQDFFKGFHFQKIPSAPNYMYLKI